MKTICQLVFLGAILGMLSSDALAQRGGGRPGGGEGGRGGRPGGIEGGRGGGSGPRGGGFRGGGGDAGGRGGFGGQSGGRGGFGGDTGGRGGFGGGSTTGGRGGFGGPGGATRGGFGGGMSRLDSNGDGRLDQSELDRIPDGFKQAMESRGIKLRPGTIEEVSSNMRSGFERARSGEGGDPRSDRESQANRSAYSPAAPFRAREKERVTVDLPPKYSELDLDFDGQIGLYEWITAKRESLNEFDEIDVNVDGLLTPKELKFYDEITEAGEAKVVSYKRDRVLIIDGSGEYTGRRSGQKTSQTSTMTPEEQKKTLASGKNYFAAMDKNKNGKVDKEEWEASKRIRPWFEKSGIKISSMGEEDFSKNFLKAVEMMKKGGDKEKGEGKDKRRR